MVSEIKPSHPCEVCHKEASNQCGGCKKVFYCDKICQKYDWPNHKKICAKLKAARDEPVVNRVGTSRLGTRVSLDDRIAAYRSSLKSNGHFFGLKKANLVYKFGDRTKINGLSVLPCTKEKRLMTMMIFNQLQIGKEMYDLFDTLPHVKIIEEETDFTIFNPKDCCDFLFKDKDWFSLGDRELKSLLFNSFDVTTDFLSSKGYERVENPEVGDIVVYSTNVKNISRSNIVLKLSNGTKTSHYGRVVRIGKKGSIYVQSKFANGHTYEHRLELIPYFFGKFYAFFKELGS